jgi:hypothetical protein
MVPPKFHRMKSNAAKGQLSISHPPEPRKATISPKHSLSKKGSPPLRLNYK